MRWLDGITTAADMNLSKFREMVTDKQPWRAAVLGFQRVRHNWATEQQPKLPFHMYIHESRQIGSDQTGDGKSEHQHPRKQRTKMDWNG